MTPAARQWPRYYTASAFPDRKALALAHSPRAAACLVAARLFPPPPPDSGLAVALETIGEGFERWEVTWTDGRTRRRIGQFTLAEGMHRTTPETPTMTNEEKRQRRRQAALKGVQTRKAKEAEAPSPPAPPAQPDAPTGREILAHAQQIGREADLWRRAHDLHCPTRPSQWNGRQRLALATILGMREPTR